MSFDDVRLLDGHHLYRLPDGWRHATADGRFLRLTGADATLAAFRHLAIGHDATPAQIHDSEDLAALIAAYRNQGLLVDGGPGNAGAAHELPTTASLTVRVVGTNPVASLVRSTLHLLQPAPMVLQAAAGEGAGLLEDSDVGAFGSDGSDLGACDLLVVCADWPSDSDWCEVDAAATRARVAWHRTWLEGAHRCVGPLTVPGVTAGWRDLRSRVLAASGVADEVAAFWRYLDNDAEPKPAPVGSVAADAVAAGLICADVEAFITTGAPARANVRHDVDLHTGMITTRPVLPLPVTA